MAWVRQLPANKDGVRLWAATVRTPAGRITVTDRLKGVVKSWADEQESQVRRSDWIDPRLAEKTVRETWERHGGARRLEMASRKRDESHWRCHVEPRWGPVAVGAIVKPDVTAWVNEMEENHVGAWTIIAALNVLKAVLELAVDANYIRSNPARRVRPPLPPAHIDRVLDQDEEVALLARLDELFPDRRDGRLFVETMLETGGRWEEVAAVKRDAVDLRHGLITFGPVMERDGTVRDYPKGARTRQAAGFRPVPIGDDLLARLRPIVLATAMGELVYTAPRGGSLLYPTWKRRVWDRALRVPVLEADGKQVTGRDGRAQWAPLLEPPLPTPHDCRHTYGTRLADAGVEQHDRMALMGHEDVRSAQRYTHSGAGRFERARAALAAARGYPIPAPRAATHDSQPTHDLG